jgi:hypothetical protein
MFRIEDGRDSFYQWDSNRRLIIEDNSISEVHYCNKTDDCSLVTEVYEDNGKYYSNVPNILLQTDWAIKVYAFNRDYTKHCKTFKVNARTKPADYIYEETELRTWQKIVDYNNELIASIGDIEAAIDEIIAIQEDIIGGGEE